MNENACELLTTLPNVAQKPISSPFKKRLSEAIFGWSQRGEKCQECHVNGYVKELRQAVESKRISADAVCHLPRLKVEPVGQGSNGVLTDWL